MSWQSKLLTYVVILLLIGTSVLAITAMVSSYWGRVPSQSLHFGLTIICDDNETCSSRTLIGADDVLNLLITAFIFSAVLSMTCGHYGTDQDLCLLCSARWMFFAHNALGLRRDGSFSRCVQLIIRVILHFLLVLRCGMAVCADRGHVSCSQFLLISDGTKDDIG
ncbi:unnamed protein product [Ranitomeya imitator]|uniref:Uncharacterized protein n=1 Tax=Ranitomeya imitator TaxID=111125 RepID=A0ABN9MPY1_9NEOB|nr:unnamed protein product [Ranitomeya imitator]